MAHTGSSRASGSGGVAAFHTNTFPTVTSPPFRKRSRSRNNGRGQGGYACRLTLVEEDCRIQTRKRCFSFRAPYSTPPSARSYM